MSGVRCGTMSPALARATSARPVRTLLLLRSWALWRVQQGGWSSAKEWRRREFAREAGRLEADFRECLAGASAASPLFGNKPAEKLLQQWVPESLVELRR